MDRQPNHGRIKEWAAAKLLKLAERLDPFYAFRCMSPFSFTYELNEGIRWREDGRGCRLWYTEADKARAWSEADTGWIDAGPAPGG